MSRIHPFARLPSLNALRVFEAAARHLSFRRAAEELALTPTAVSHQIRLLEDRLGLPLFTRQARRVALTEAGQRLYPVLRDSFDHIGQTLAALRAPSPRLAVTVSATRGFAALWLLPRLPAFAAAHPDIDLHLHASDAPVDLLQGQADLALRYGRVPPPGLHAEVLLRCRFAPVCSPRLDLHAPTQLSSLPRLRFEWRQRDRRTPDWALWFRKAGVAAGDASERMFSDEAHAIVAAISGQGVLLANLALVAGELRGGTLVQPFGPVLEGHPIRLLWPPRHAGNEAVMRVRGWLREQAAEMAEADPDNDGFPAAD